MDSSSYLGHLRRDFGAFAECLAGDLAAPVEPCGDWTLYDLTDDPAIAWRVTAGPPRLLWAGHWSPEPPRTLR